VQDQSLRREGRIAQFGADGAPSPAPPPRFAVLGVDLLADGALIVIVVDVSVALANGVPRGDLRHQTVWTAIMVKSFTG
jgi:hypothetical protein